MKKIILSLIVLVASLSACENKTESASNQDQEQINNEEISVVDLKDFEGTAADLVGKKVKLTGTIDHVCQHGGQKMFIVSKDADARVKIVTGENMAAFNTDLVGETISLVGIVDELRIDENYLREWEEELSEKAGPEQENPAMHAKEQKGEKLGEGEHHEEEQSPDMQQINNLRQQLAESGKEYLSYFSIICVEYEVVKENTEEQPAA
jgi:fructose-specific component phosphotransferase system IIB-like protein